MVCKIYVYIYKELSNSARTCCNGCARNVHARGKKEPGMKGRKEEKKNGKGICKVCKRDVWKQGSVGM